MFRFEQCNVSLCSTRCKEEYECNSWPWMTPASSSGTCLPPPQWNPNKVALSVQMFHFEQLHINALREVVWIQFSVSSSSSCLPLPPLRSQIRVLSIQQVQTFISWMSSKKSFITIVVGRRGSVKSSQASLSLPKCFCSPHNLAIFPRRDRGNGNWCRKDLPGNANFAVAVKPYK